MELWRIEKRVSFHVEERERYKKSKDSGGSVEGTEPREDGTGRDESGMGRREGENVTVVTLGQSTSFGGR